MAVDYLGSLSREQQALRQRQFWALHDAEHYWHEVYTNVVALARWLVEERHFTAQELLGYLGKPWNWGDEWREYQAATCKQSLQVQPKENQ